MNSKTSKRHKTSPKRGRPPNKLKKNEKNGEAEIFVIPPHLLQKLGINLGSVIANQGDLSNAKLKDEAVVANELAVGPLDNGQSHKDSSESTTQKHTPHCSTILETATLMKQSVFLSPTFNDDSKTILGNIENVTQHAEYSTFAREDVRENSAYPEKKSSAIDVVGSQFTLNTAPVVLSGNKCNDISIQGEIGNVFPSNEAVKEAQIQNSFTDVSDKVTRQSSTDDHPDEAYLSDCSNLGSLETGDSVNCIPIENNISSKLPQEHNSKINIISEEILDTVQINELKKLHNTKPSDLFPVSLTSVITKDMCKKDITHNKVTKLLPSFDNLKKNARNDPKSPEPCIIVDNLILYDEKGNVLQTYNAFDSKTTVDGETNKSDILTVNDAQIEIGPNDYTVDIQNQENTCVVSESNFGVCIDLAETDIEMHLKENEDTLVKFVNEITSNDNDAILTKIENSEEDSFSRTEEKYIEQDVADNIHTVVQESELNSSNVINVSNCINKQNVDNKVISSNSVNTVSPDNDNNTNEKKIADEDIQCQSELSDSKKSLQNSESSQSSSFGGPETKKSQDKNNEVVSEKENEHVDDKIKEIATYLRQFAEMRSKSQTKKHQKHLLGKLPIKVPEENSLKTKLCIQGVEKPGGSEESDNNNKNPKIIKCYTRAKSSKIISRVPANIAHSNNSQEEVNISNIDQGENSIIIANNTLKTQDFCLCGDFGRLEFSESDVPYEHIHFWDHDITDVGDENLINDNQEQSDQEKTDDSIMYKHTICWNILLNEKSLKIVHKTEAQHSKELEKCNFAQDINIEHNVSSCSSLTADNSNKQYQYSESTGADQMEKKTAEDLPDNSKNKNGLCVKKLKQHVQDAKITLKQSNVAEMEVDVCIESIEDQSDTPQLHTITEGKSEVIKRKPQKRGKKSIESVINEKNELMSPSKKAAETSFSNITVETEAVKQISKEDQSQSQLKKLRRSHDDTSSRKSLSSSDIKDEPNQKKIKTRAEKRKQSIAQEETNVGNEGPRTKQNKAAKDDVSPTHNVECAVCERKVTEGEWEDHAREEHNYIAWIAGGSFDSEDEKLIENVKTILKNKGTLLCQICQTEHKRPKTFIKHVLKCMKTSTEEKQKTEPIEKTEEVEETRKVVFSDTVKCAICKIDVEANKWLEHSQQNHNYLAWRDGDEPMDLKDDEVIRTYLMEVLKQVKDLKCFKCGLTRKYAKTFLKHIQNCNENSSSLNADTSCDVSQVDQTISEDNSVVDNNQVKCGVCHQEVDTNEWLEHIQDKHEYMAWKEGESLDLSNEEEVYNHLNGIAQTMGGLKCSKCNLVRKYVKSYKTHIKSCTLKYEDFNTSSETTSIKQKTSNLESGKVECAVCSEQIDVKYWNNHKMKKHYNVAWYVGDIPIDYKNSSVIERFVREYRDANKSMVCSNCGTSRASCMGFYAHVIVCGKSEEEVDRLHRTTCKICNKKYLWVYQSQHMKWHNDQEFAKEQKQKRLEMMEKEIASPKEDTSGDTTGRRRKAAQKALNVIEKYSNDGLKHVCQVCRYATDCEKDLAKHDCLKTKARDYSDSEDSVQLDLESGEESDESNIESDLSDDVEQMLARKRKRHRDYVSISSKIPRFLSKQEHVNGYLIKSGIEFRECHLTSERLFPEWCQTKYETVPDDKLSRYMPPLAESCKVRFSDPAWTTYKRLECIDGKGRNSSIFVGACIQSVFWVPSPLHDEGGSRQYLTVLCHLDTDLPRIDVEPTVPGPGLIQIWDYGKFDSSPKFALGLTHDFGTAWAAEWCPSGTRDTITEAEPTGILRLGLLAVAFSTGRVFIFSVPYPSSIVKNDSLFYHIKPVAELRLTMSSDRKQHQATSISWSMQKNHDCIVVGYGDGTIAYFDLNTESPFLKTKESDVTIFYPYEDERAQNSSITGLCTYPSSSPLSLTGAVCVSSPTGAALLRRGVRQSTHTVSARAIFQPLWPSAALAGEDVTSTIVNEVEWFGGGRRLGAAGAAAGCAGCGRVALHAPPLLRVVRPHPVVPQFNRHLIGILQMVPLGKKRKKLENDDLQVIVEPITYQDAVNKYGIELRIDKEAISKQSLAARELFPDRFPLAEVPSMAFCPSAEHHKKLAVATHAGIVFLLNV